MALTRLELSPEEQDVLAWVNETLRLHAHFTEDMVATDVQSDFQDGVRLLQLLEVVTSQSVGNINR